MRLPRSGDPEWLDALHVCLDGFLGIPKVNGALEVEPELRRVSKQPGETQSHLRSESPTFPEELVHSLS